MEGAKHRKPLRLKAWHHTRTDADKRATGGYFEQVLQLVRPGGVIAVDNVLFRGRVADPEVWCSSSIEYITETI